VRWTGEGDPESSQRPWLGEVFEPQTVEGFGDRLLDAYTELRFHYGRFKSESPYLPLALPSEGWRFDAWLGWQKGIGQKQNFAPLGIDVQPFINLFGGDRVLRLRLHVQTALGHRDNIPFLDVPSLGGATLLRGYDTRRFRGRLAVLTTAEYRYPIQPKLAAYVFVDAGRVYADFADFGVDNLRVGYGGGLLMFTRTFFLARLQIASSIDGNVFVEFQFGTNHALGRRN
jgi:outer membrane protein assembly factor BamA